MGVGLELKKAIRSMNNDKTRRLLERIDAETVNEANVHGVNHGLTPLHDAATMNNMEAMTKLLSIPGINVNARNNTGNTPIMWAPRKNSVEALEALVDHPAVDVNVRDNNGCTPVMWAVRFCSLEALQALLDHSAVDLDVRSNNGRQLEDVVIAAHYVASDYLTKKLKCLDMIQEARRKREAVSLEQDQANNASDFSESGNSLEEMKTNVRKVYIDKIDKVNEHIQEYEKKLDNNRKRKLEEIKNLEEKQDLEQSPKKMKLEQKKSKLEHELADIQNEIKKHDEEKKKEHKHKRAILEDTFEKEDKEVHQQLCSLKEMANQLAKELRKQDMDPDDDASANLEAARDTLECPVCMEIMRPPTKIFMCPSSHLICEVCKHQLEGKLCPTCRTEMVSLRALMAEKFGRTLFNK